MSQNPTSGEFGLLDQFEELFRFQRSFEDKSHEAAEFARLLLAATSEYRARLYVVITMRSDYLGECARFPGLAEALNGSQYLTPRLTKEELREAMTGPPALRNVSVEPTWLESVLDQTAENRDQLPLLQHVLRQMWNRPGRGSQIGEADSRAVGGLNALNEHADAVYSEVGNKELARRIFQYLTESAEPGRENRRPRTIQELIEEAASDFSAVEAVVDHFREEGCNFLSPPKHEELKPDSVIDITHESLIRGWTQLKEWPRKDADSGEWYRRVEDRLRTSKGKTYLASPELEAAVEAWKEGGWNPAWAKRYAGKKDPKQYDQVVRWLEESQRERSRRARRRLWILAGVALGLALLAAAAMWAAFAISQQKRRAEKGEIRIAGVSAALVGGVPGRGLDALQQAIHWTGKADSQKLPRDPQVLQALTLGLSDLSESRPLCCDLNKVVEAVDFSADGQMIATAGRDSFIRLWNVATGELIDEWQHPNAGENGVFGLAFSSQGGTLASVPLGGTPLIWDTTRKPASIQPVTC